MKLSTALNVILVFPLVSVHALGGNAGHLRATKKNEQKVAICHRTGKDKFVKIHVSINALQAHLDHGDHELNLYYFDSDGDGFGDQKFDIKACSQPEGYADNDKDCDDTDATVNPDAAETCGDGIDNNCDGAIDEGCDPPGCKGIWPIGGRTNDSKQDNENSCLASCQDLDITIYAATYVADVSWDENCFCFRTDPSYLSSSYPENYITYVFPESSLQLPDGCS